MNEWTNGRMYDGMGQKNGPKINDENKLASSCTSIFIFSQGSYTSFKNIFWKQIFNFFFDKFHLFHLSRFFPLKGKNARGSPQFKTSVPSRLEEEVLPPSPMTRGRVRCAPKHTRIKAISFDVKFVIYKHNTSFFSSHICAKNRL